MAFLDNDPNIRPIRPEEAPEAKRLIYTIAHPLMAPELTLEEMMNQWESWGVFTDLEDIQKNYFDDNGTFLVVEAGGQMVGTGAFHRYTVQDVFAPGGRLRTEDEGLRTGEGVCELHRIALLREYAGHKLGYLAYALLLGLIERARELGYTRMILWTDPIHLHRAVDFYHRLGFTDLLIEGTDPDELWLGLPL